MNRDFPVPDVAHDTSRSAANGADLPRTARRLRAMNSAWLLALAAARCAAPDASQAAAGRAADSAGKCPVMGAESSAVAAADAAARPAAGGGLTNQDWWPDQLDLRVLHQNAPAGNPMGKGFD